MSTCKSSTNCDEKNLIVIVGSGLAGLSAADRLIKSGHDNLLILEASDRLGGRVQTCEFLNGDRVDLGAQWLHGGHSNPVYKWLDEELDLIEVEEDEEVEFEGLFRHPELCTNKADEIIVARCLEILLEARHALYEMSSNLITTKCKPLELYRKHLWDEASRCPRLSKARKGLIAATLRWFELYETIDNSCNHMANLSVKAYSEWTDFDNGLMVTLKGGWSSVVDKLTGLIGRDKIKLNSRLVKLIHTDHPRILFESCKTKSVNVIDCERIILTVSIGVLKSWILESTFVPPLEEKKANLIQRLGFGVVNKIFVQFREPFLQEEMGLKLLWSDEDLKSEIFPPWALNLTGFDVCRKQPNILMGWINGPEVECLSEQEVSRVCEMIFAHFLKTEQQVPKIIGVRISSWAHDRNFQGSYSYESIETENDIRADLWAPLGSEEAPEAQLIFFAGEATAHKMYSTAHGAIVSGWREADLVLESLKNHIAQ